MNIIGIIIESNPFHNGHLYFINELKKIYKPDLLVAVSTTSFTMRGEISVIDKFSKTDALLNAGIDVVLEYPFILSTQSSDYFALNALTILNDFGVNHLVCGCETSHLSLFDKIYEIEQSPIFDHKLKENLKKYSSYKVTFQNTLKELNLNIDELELFNKPNFTLAYQYYKVIKSKFNNIKFSLIQRTNDYHNKSLSGKLSSATAIREALMKKQDVENFVPFKYNYIEILKANENLFNLLKYKMTTFNDENISFDKEGIINYIRKYLFDANTYQEFINLLKNKRYSISRINRYILYIILNIKSLSHEEHYLRILGINKFGIDYIKQLPINKKELIFANIKEITQTSHSYKTANIELLATKIYSIITNNNDLIIKEYQLPIRKKDD